MKFNFNIEEITASLLEASKDEKLAIETAKVIAESLVVPLPKDVLISKAKKGDISILTDPLILIEKQDGIPVLSILFKNMSKLPKGILELDEITTLKDQNNATPLHYLCANKNLINSPKFIKSILNHPDITEVKDNEGKTPLHWLALNISEFNLVNYIFDIPEVATVFDNDNKSPATIIAERIPNNHKKVKFIALHEFSNLFPYEPEKNVISILAVKQKGVRYILQREDIGDTLVNYKGVSIPLLNLMADFGIKDVLKVRKIKLEEVKDNETGNTPLHILASKGVEEILNYNYKVSNNDGITPLHYLAKALVDKAILVKESKELVDNNGDTPQHYFASALIRAKLPEDTLTKKATTLVANGSPFPQNVNGDTILHILAKGGIRVVASVKEANEIRNNKGLTAMQILLTKLK